MRAKRRKHLTPWPPAELMLPDSIEEIERGRPPKQQSLLDADDTPPRRLRRMRPPKPQHADDCGVEWW